MAETHTTTGTKPASIALAQIACKRGDIAANMETHLRFANTASAQGAQLIAFPELSLTGYEPDLAQSLAFSPDDRRLEPLRDAAAALSMILLAGAPVCGESGIHIGAFLIFPDGTTAIYTKRYLHPGEERFFVPGTLNPPIVLGADRIALAICADIANPRHADDAANAGSTVYLASALISVAGYPADAGILEGFAKRHHMTVLLSNHGGPSGGYESAGRSAVWSDQGVLIAGLNGPGEGLVMVTRGNNGWTGLAVNF